MLKRKKMFGTKDFLPVVSGIVVIHPRIPDFRISGIDSLARIKLPSDGRSGYSKL